MAATPATGKTHIRYCRMLLDGANLSGDMRSVSSFGVSYEQADATGWATGSRQWLTGHGNVMLDGFTAIFSNEAEATGPIQQGSHTELSDIKAYLASIFIGIRTAPAIGNDTFSAAMEQGSYYVSGGGNDPAMVNAAFFGSATLPEAAAVWGVCLADGTELSATTNNASVDNGASSSGGYIAILHVTQTTAAIGDNDWAFTIEHSSNDSDWSTLATFTADGSAVMAERLEGSGTVNRYVRFVGTRTAGTAAVWCSFIRK